MSHKDNYSILGITEGATIAEVKTAFRKLAAQHHPDKSGGDTTKFVEIRAAYEAILRDGNSLSAPYSSRDVVSKKPSSQPRNSTGYDPFTDAHYGSRVFFQPANAGIEPFERSVRAQNCPYCHGLGTMTKNVQPEKGFLGLETRFCKCQWAPSSSDR